MHIEKFGLCGDDGGGAPSLGCRICCLMSLIASRPAQAWPPHVVVSAFQLLLHWKASTSLKQDNYSNSRNSIDGSHLRNRGCEGGTAYEALLYIKRNGGIVFSEHYPYIGKQCVPKKLTAPGLMIDDAANYTSISEHVLKWQVAQ
ncbi:zingipain-1-like [Triticum aestivum]|uniref:zingipain-1-like n=1 Tax=Triticum aestivum TaxID=4565 RepID=UPI001D00CDDF|nr:zingipain-1-like [Triticum aestivum]